MLLATPAAARRLPDILDALALRHDRLCPRQVLGVRIGLAGLEALGVAYAPGGRSVIAFVETDGCFVSGVEVASGCAVGHRTLQVRDYGKVAATFVDVASGRAFRILPRSGVRDRARTYSDDARPYYAQLQGYQVMPSADLLQVIPVRLRENLAGLLGRAGVRVDCERCGEEVTNAREVTIEGRLLCRSCSERAYYAPASLD